eukprot:TRINITY_DN2833_c0_g1_i1.p1 TRINITY_DN2833_c0_g1~~TRINITY_DN2833_c0_g1_i1.p1  ORF type:complete len:243 (-),score=46.29 TRINITY_DN2833_c0_g1_i1:33-707(-)
MANATFSRRGGLECPGYLSGQATSLGVVVIQEWWGLNKQIQTVADELSSRGFRTLCPDLYRGKVATDHETAGHYFNDLDWKGALEDIQGAIDHLHALGCKKVGVVGFCMGGALTIASAANCTGLHAASAFYGIPSDELFKPENLKIPIQLHFGNQDPIEGFSDPKAANNLEAKLKSAGVNFEFYRYENAAHAFVNKEHPESYVESATQEALWTRTVEFFQKNLN